MIWFFAGWHRIRVTGASPEWIHGAMAKRRVAFRDFRKTDDFTAELVIPRRALPAACAAARKAMCELTVSASGGAPVLLAGLRKRPAFPVMLAVTALLAFACTRFVWFYEVSGNVRVPSQKILRELRELMAKRKASQPLEWPSAGSTFKRPEGHFAGTLIDQCGLKGLTVGGAQVSEKHAGFLINRGGATFADMAELIRQVQQRVLEETGVTLEPEVKIVK
mgnify:CR=1 FL=1